MLYILSPTAKISHSKVHHVRIGIKLTERLRIVDPVLACRAKQGNSERIVLTVCAKNVLSKGISRLRMWHWEEDLLALKVFWT